jgi:hypothetical protein
MQHEAPLLRRAAAAGLAAACLGLWLPARASEDHNELALRANEVHIEHCGDMYAGNISTAAEGFRQVADAWEEVDAAYKDSEEPYLLYWRGMLAECLSQNDQARFDLQTFLDAHAETAGLGFMVTDAKRRLRRLDLLAEGKTAQPIASRSGGVEFYDDPRAQTELTEWELRRYRRSGLTLEAYQDRRHAFKGRNFLMIDVQLGYGPTQPVTTYVQDEFHQSYYFDETLVGAWSPRVHFALEIWGLDVLGFGFMAGALLGWDDLRTVDTETIDHPPEPTDSAYTQIFWLEAGVWAGTTFLPKRLVKPIVRLGLAYRFAPRGTGFSETWQPNEFWSVASLGGFVGAALDGRKGVGVEVGCWITGDLGANKVFDTDIDLDDVTDDLEAITAVPSFVSVRPGIAVRFAL